jgi:hypothetical protein
VHLDSKWTVAPIPWRTPPTDEWFYTAAFVALAAGPTLRAENSAEHYTKTGFKSGRRSIGAARETCFDHFCKYPGTARDPHLDHDQPEKGVHRVGTDVHSICNLFVGKALQQ